MLFRVRLRFQPDFVYPHRATALRAAHVGAQFQRRARGGRAEITERGGVHRVGSARHEHPAGVTSVAALRVARGQGIRQRGCGYVGPGVQREAGQLQAQAEKIEGQAGQIGVMGEWIESVDGLLQRAGDGDTVASIRPKLPPKPKWRAAGNGHGNGHGNGNGTKKK